MSSSLHSLQSSQSSQSLQSFQSLQSLRSLQQLYASSNAIFERAPSQITLIVIIRTFSFVNPNSECMMTLKISNGRDKRPLRHQD